MWGYECIISLWGDAHIPVIKSEMLVIPPERYDTVGIILFTPIRGRGCFVVIDCNQLSDLFHHS